MSRIFNLRIIKIFFITSLVIFCSLHVLKQKPIEYQQGMGWDGRYYFAAYNVFKGKGAEILPAVDGHVTNFEFVKKGFPFNQRWGIPFLASLLPFSAAVSFKVIDLLFFAAGSFLLFFKWAKDAKQYLLPLMLITWLIVLPLCPFRGALFYPFNVDGAQYLYLALLLLTWKNINYVSLITILFLPFKESALIFYIIYVICSIVIFYIAEQNSSSRYNSIKYISRNLLFTGITLFSFFVYRKILLHNGMELGSSFHTIIEWVNVRLFDPEFYVRLLVSIFFAYGYFLFIFLENVKLASVIKDTHFLFFLLLFLILPFTGSDLTRIVGSLLPVLFDMIVKFSKRRPVNLGKIILAIILFLPLTNPVHILWFNQDSKIGEGIFEFTGEWASISRVMIIFIYGTVCCYFLNINATEKMLQKINSVLLGSKNEYYKK